MKKTLIDYYPADSDSLKKLWPEAVFVFDTNVLLNLYKYTAPTSTELLHLMAQLGDAIWIPHQVAHEYQKNRAGVITTEREYVAKAKRAVEDARKKALEAFPEREGGSFLDKDVVALRAQVDKSFDALAKRVDALQRKLKVFPEVVGKDRIRDSLVRLFHGRVGAPWSTARLLEAYDEAERRIRHGVPPGYEDNKKAPPDRYGDIIVWKQMMEFAEANKRPIIFVTAEKKPDWWLFSGTELIGPRPELRREMRDQAGVGFHVYRVPQFMERAAAHMKASVKEDTVKEVEEVQQADDAAEAQVGPRTGGLTVGELYAALDTVRPMSALSGGFLKHLTDEMGGFNSGIYRVIADQMQGYNIVRGIAEQLEGMTANPMSRWAEELQRMTANPMSRWAEELQRMTANPVSRWAEELQRSGFYSPEPASEVTGMQEAMTADECSLSQRVEAGDDQKNSPNDGSTA